MLLLGSHLAALETGVEVIDPTETAAFAGSFEAWEREEKEVKKGFKIGLILILINNI